MKILSAGCSGVSVSASALGLTLNNPAIMLMKHNYTFISSRSSSRPPLHVIPDNRHSARRADASSVSKHNQGWTDLHNPRRRRAAAHLNSDGVKVS